MAENKDINRIKVVLAEKKRTNKWLAEQLHKDPATVYRVGQGHYCPLPPSEPYVRVSPHTAQAFQSLCSCAETGSSYFLFPLFLRDNLKHSS